MVLVPYVLPFMYIGQVLVLEYFFMLSLLTSMNACTDVIINRRCASFALVAMIVAILKARKERPVQLYITGRLQGSIRTLKR